VSGQVAFDPLFSSQKFYLGGAGYGPGYYSGDNGVSGLFELRFDKALSNKWLNKFQIYAFIDGGAAWDRNSDKQGLTSAGPGLRVTLFDNLYAGIAYAIPIAQTSKTEEYKTSRLLFNLSTSLKFCPDRVERRCFAAESN
jgi:hemolysin activation/secretion protein